MSQVKHVLFPVGAKAPCASECPVHVALTFQPVTATLFVTSPLHGFLAGSHCGSRDILHRQRPAPCQAYGRLFSKDEQMRKGVWRGEATRPGTLTGRGTSLGLNLCLRNAGVPGNLSPLSRFFFWPPGLSVWPHWLTRLLESHALRYPWVDPSEDSARSPGCTDPKLGAGPFCRGVWCLPQALQAEGAISSTILSQGCTMASSRV